MNIFKFFTYFCIFSMLSAEAMHQVKVDSVSDTGRTVKLNIGSLNSIKVLDQGNISVKTGSSEVPKFGKSFLGKVVKVFPNFSYWYFEDVERKYFIKDSSYSLQLIQNTMSGRKSNDFSYEIKAYENRRVKDDIDRSLVKNFPDSMISNNNVEISAVNTEDMNLEDEVKVERVVELSKNKNIIIDDDYEDINFLRNDKVDISNLNEETNYINDEGNAQNQKQLKRVTKKEHGLKELYYDGRAGTKTLQLSIPSVSDEYYDEINSKAEIKTATRVMVNSQGPMWSGDMNKDELQNYLIKSGLAKENSRRRYSMLLKSSNEVTIFLGSNLSKNYIQDDKSYQNTGFSLGISYELHLVRASKSFERYSFDLLLERGSLNIGLSEINARLAYGLLGGHLNFYLYNYPHSRNQVAVYLGAGIKRGNGELESANLEKLYDYEILTIPSLQFGAKYRSPSANDYEIHSSLGFGINFRLSYDMIKVAAISNVTDDFEANKSLNNLKADLGFSFFF